MGLIGLGIVRVNPQFAPFDFQPAAFKTHCMQNSGLPGIVGDGIPNYEEGKQPAGEKSKLCWKQL